MSARKFTEKEIGVMHELRESGWSYERISRALGCDHTTVLYHLNPEYRRRKMGIARGIDLNASRFKGG